MLNVSLDSRVSPSLHGAQAISGANGNIGDLEVRCSPKRPFAEGEDRLTGEPIRKSLGRKRLNAACRSITPPLT
jgi:hypothetical protein